MTDSILPWERQLRIAIKPLRDEVRGCIAFSSLSHLHSPSNAAGLSSQTPPHSSFNAASLSL
ncbi:hypothetical protein RchiOBHm_Chr2g0129521 [Rosa chinensis]|uniref:Uncharacterized protein n=1 Tax=Rosa chinensis TaxID=74649 RepID=A0A2P6RUL9_ROSCH|nr:hypothetical protein RchiOBHm_Chr2g0129521 [Rosa chinensis]